MTRKKKTFTILGVSITILSIIGISYAYWFLTHTQVGENKIATSCLSLSITNEKNDINLQKAYPISDEEGKNLIPYSFTITNTCDMFTSYTVSLEMLKDSTMSSEFLKTMVNKEEVHNLSTLETTDVVNTGSIESRILANGSLGSGDSVDYTLRVWMDGDSTSTESMNKDFIGKVIVTARTSHYSPCEQGFCKLNEAILANEYQTTSLESAKEKIQNKQTVDFTKTAPIIEWQENHESTTIITTATMPHEDLVGNSDPKYTNLTRKNILPRIGTSYTFDKETGKYTIGNPQYVDPTTLNYNSNTNYYICNAGFYTNANDLVQPYQNVLNCTNIYKITGATSSDGTITGTNGTVIKTKVYKITGYAYTQNELESDKSDKGLYQMLENNVPIYYYRGSVSNNYVKFGGYFWRIIRTNSDGSIRLLYAGSTPKATGNNLNMKLTDSTLGYTNSSTSSFNRMKNNPGYVGYMYGNTLGASYEQTNANETDSAIKKYLDSWYKQNIVDQNLEEYIADAGFCNDRSLASIINYPTNGNGVQTDKTTYYAGYERYYKTKTPKLECNQNDFFTTSSSITGNKALIYPIGLITVDELMLSGLADGYLNRLAYTYSSSHYWTISPRHFGTESTTAHGFSSNADGYVRFEWITNGSGIRGSINLRSNVEITGGIGTANDPFIIKTN